MQALIRRSRYPSFVCLAIIVLSSTLWAEEKSWSDIAELSFVKTGGNTDIVSFKAKNRLEYRYSDEWSFQWGGAMLFAQSDGEKSAERYDTDLRVDYTLSRGGYFYGQMGWSQDKFAGLDNRYFGGPGVGYTISPGGRHVLSLELGGQLAKEIYSDGSESDFMEGRAFGEYEYRFNDAVRFEQELEYLHNFRASEEFSIIAISSLRTKLNDRLGLRVSYEIRYINQPRPERLKSTDTLLSVSLVVNF